MPNQPNPLNEALMNDEVSLTFTRRQWIFLFNVLVSGSYKFGVAAFLKDIVDKIEPIAAVATNIDRPEDKE